MRLYSSPSFGIQQQKQIRTIAQLLVLTASAHTLSHIQKTCVPLYAELSYQTLCDYVIAAFRHISKQALACVIRLIILSR